MNTIDTIECVLRQKGYDVWSIGPDVSVYEALEVMAKRNAGALLVMQRDNLLGVISERDYTRKVVLQGKTSKETKVREIMTSPVITISLRHSVEEGLRMMTESRVRHLPVVVEGKIIGLVSIGNLVNWIITAQNMKISHLENYITGSYPG